MRLLPIGNKPRVAGEELGGGMGWLARRRAFGVTRIDVQPGVHATEESLDSTSETNDTLYVK